MKKTFIGLLCVGLVATGITGCDSMTKQDVGVVTGGAVGALVGSQFGGGSGRSVAIAAGAIAGGLIGGQVGKSMDNVDQMQVSRALETTPSNRSTSWRNPDSGNIYSVKPTKNYYRHARAGGRQPCREYTTTVNIGGKRQQIYGTACRQSDGSWKVVR